MVVSPFPSIHYKPCWLSSSRWTKFTEVPSILPWKCPGFSFEGFLKGQGRVYPGPSVPMVFMVFSRDAWGLFHPQTPTKKGFFLSGFFPGLSQDIVVPASLKGFVHTKRGIPRWKYFKCCNPQLWGLSKAIKKYNWWSITWGPLGPRPH